MCTYVCCFSRGVHKCVRKQHNMKQLNLTLQTAHADNTHLHLNPEYPCQPIEGSNQLPQAFLSFHLALLDQLFEQLIHRHGAEQCEGGCTTRANCIYHIPYTYVPMYLHTYIYTYILFEFSFTDALYSFQISFPFPPQGTHVFFIETIPPRTTCGCRQACLSLNRGVKIYTTTQLNL